MKRLFRMTPISIGISIIAITHPLNSQTSDASIDEIWNVKFYSPETQSWEPIFTGRDISFGEKAITVKVGLDPQFSIKLIKMVSMETVFQPERLFKTFEKLDTQNIFRWIVYQTKKQYDGYGNELSTKDVNVFSFEIDRETVNRISWDYIKKEFYDNSLTPFFERQMNANNLLRDKSDEFYAFVKKFMKKKWQLAKEKN